MLADQFTLDDGVLWHVLSQNLDMGEGNLPLKQLCIPAILKLYILQAFHEQGSSHKS